MPNKAFLEITNACNLSCSFCHGTKREIKYITEEEFTLAAAQIRGYADYLYFHLMGEPLLHPKLSNFLKIAKSLDFKVILTTNGTLLGKCQDILLSEYSPFKVSISLHSFEANKIGIPLSEYLNMCFDFCKNGAENGIICVMRLWNKGSENSLLNDEIISEMHKYFDKNCTTEWKEIYSGYKICNKIFLEWGERFDWPDIDGEVVGENYSCYGLRDQFGVLCDGTVVPCCLDADGSINLGNIFKTPLSEILSSPRAVALRNSFINKDIKEELCRRCGYAKGKNYR